MNLLYNNPKVLYTPNGTAADEVIKKVYTDALLAAGIHMSSELVDYVL